MIYDRVQALIDAAQELSTELRHPERAENDIERLNDKLAEALEKFGAPPAFVISGWTKIACGCVLETQVSNPILGVPYCAVIRIDPCSVHKYDIQAGEKIADDYQRAENERLASIFGLPRPDPSIAGGVSLLD